MIKVGNYKDQQKRHNYVKDYASRSNEASRLICVYYYSGGSNKCQCCGESHYEFLCIDHLNKTKDENKLNRSGIGLYLWLIKNEFPKGFRVLCHNCNMARGFYGECPHSY